MCCVSKKSLYTNFYLSCQAAEVRVHGVLHTICNHSPEPRDLQRDLKKVIMII